VTTIHLTIEREVEVTGTVTRHHRATQHDPEEGGEVEDIEATLDGNPIELTCHELAEAETALTMQAAADAAEARAAQADWERDERREARD
jgi:hypothetical protein